MLIKPVYYYYCWDSHVWARSRRDTSAHAQRNHLTAERCRFTARLWHRAGDCLHEGPSVTRLQLSHRRGLSFGNSTAGLGSFTHDQPPREMQPAADWVRLFGFAPSLHGSSRECHGNQESLLRDRCSSLSQTRRRTGMDPASKLPIR